MNDIKKLMVFLIPFFCGGHAIAGVKVVGNGGDAVVCTKNYRLKVELLDVFEARVLHRLSPNFQVATMIGNLNSNQIAQANAHFLASRLDNFSPLLAKRYHEYINSFLSETSFVSGVELVDVPDSNGIIIPVDCKISQLVVQVSDGSYGNTRYVINQDLWSLLDEENKAATLFHEVIYRLAIETGQNDSRWTRYFNAVIFSDQISRMTSTQFSNLRRQAYVSRFTHKGFELAGSINPDQKIYQVITGPKSETFGLNLDDGIYDMENDFLIEAHFADLPVQLNGLKFPKGLSMLFSYNGALDQIYAPAVSGNKNGVDLIAPDVNECGRGWNRTEDVFFDFCGIFKMKWDSLKSEFQILQTGLKDVKNKIQFTFDNNVKVILFVETPIYFSESMDYKAVLDQICDVSSGVCSEASIKFLNGLLVRRADGSPIEEIILDEVKIYTNGSALGSYSSRDETSISYKIPSSYSGDLSKVKGIFGTQSVQFNPNGNYSFEAYSWPRKLVTKNGSIISLAGGSYEFSFDKDGFLLSAIPK